MGQKVLFMCTIHTENTDTRVVHERYWWMHYFIVHVNLNCIFYVRFSNLPDLFVLNLVQESRIVYLLKYKNYFHIQHDKETSSGLFKPLISYMKHMWFVSWYLSPVRVPWMHFQTMLLFLAYLYDCSLCLRSLSH